MGLSRRMFTKEFKLAAVQRLEPGVSQLSWHGGKRSWQSESALRTSSARHTQRLPT